MRYLSSNDLRRRNLLIAFGVLAAAWTAPSSSATDETPSASASPNARFIDALRDARSTLPSENKEQGREVEDVQPCPPEESAESDDISIVSQYIQGLDDDARTTLDSVVKRHGFKSIAEWETVGNKLMAAGLVLSYLTRFKLVIEDLNAAEPYARDITELLLG